VDGEPFRHDAGAWIFSMLKRREYLVLPTRSAAPGFRIVPEGTVFKLIAVGSWTIREAATLDSALKGLSVPIPPSSEFTGEIDISAIEELDTAGAWLLQRTLDAWQKSGLKTAYHGATEEFGILLQAVSRGGDLQLPAEEKESAATVVASGIQATFGAIFREMAVLTAFLGAFMACLGRTILNPWQFRPVSFVHHLDRTGLRAVPIITLICILIGAVVMQQGVVQLQRFGAELLAVNMVAILALREVGVLLTAIMVAGRSGSAFTAEIGSMKMREEIDAMRILGIDPMQTLVLPRVLALMVGLPLLAFLGDIMCLAGGAIMAKVYLGIEVDVYIERLRAAVSINHFIAGMFKAPFAALIIGLVGCREGLAVEGSAESLGAHVTSAVVKAIFLVIILDACFAMFLSAIGV
jgi:phospholipid/cholesterol/gamma-HCH transport system permease protein